MSLTGRTRQSPGYTTRGDDHFLASLQKHGATRLERLSFRQNRRTIWSVTRGGTAFNLHTGYRDSPEPVIRALAVIAHEAGTGSVAYHAAAKTARDWPGIVQAIAIARRTLRRRYTRRKRHATIRCTGTLEQQRYLRSFFEHLNTTRFGGKLPANVRLRLSNRMITRLGQMVAIGRGSDRRVLEIALNIDLLLLDNREIRVDTLLHEMAHVAAFLYDGDGGHGPTWKAWARRVGCSPDRLTGARLKRREPGTAVTRVPSLLSSVR